jgi:hypothetical protein
MNKTLKILIIFILSIHGFQLFSQAPNDKLWEISLGGGFSFPIGVFSNNSASSAAILDKNVSATRVIGISKTKNGFAELGLCYNLSIKYKIAPSFRLLFLANRFVNPVQTNGLTTYLTQTHNLDIEYWESDYKMICFTPGIGYEHSLSDFIIEAGIYMGYSFAQYPYYKFILLYTMLDPPPIFAHEGSKNAIHGLTIGGSISVAYRVSGKFNIGIDAIFNSSNFKYKMSNTMIPGGSQVFEISDVLKVRVIGTILRFGYSF